MKNQRMKLAWGTICPYGLKESDGYGVYDDIIEVGTWYCATCAWCHNPIGEERDKMEKSKKYYIYCTNRK